MGDTPQDKDAEDREPAGDDKKTINDPLTGDVEAPRAEFEGRTPESG
jgi:hypothetical protein